MYTQGSSERNVGGLDWAMMQHSEVSWREKTRRLEALLAGQQPPPVVIIGTIVFIHESNKAESVLKAFTARFRAHE